MNEVFGGGGLGGMRWHISTCFLFLECDSAHSSTSRAGGD